MILINIMPYLLFLKKRQNFNCHLLQIKGGALRVKYLPGDTYTVMSYTDSYKIIIVYHMGLIGTKPVFGVSDKTRLKQVSSATETS